MRQGFSILNRELTKPGLYCLFLTILPASDFRRLIIIRIHHLRTLKNVCNIIFVLLEFFQSQTWQRSISISLDTKSIVRYPCGRTSDDNFYNLPAQCCLNIGDIHAEELKSFHLLVQAGSFIIKIESIAVSLLLNAFLCRWTSLHM